MSETTSGTLSVAVVTPEGNAFEGEARMVVVPGYDGELAFMKGHAAFVGAIGTGALRVEDASGTERRWFLQGGVAQVLNDEVVVLADRIQPADEVDKAAAEADLKAALGEVPTTDETFDARDRMLDSARARIRVADREQS